MLSFDSLRASLHPATSTMYPEKYLSVVQPSFNVGDSLTVTGGALTGITATVFDNQPDVRRAIVVQYGQYSLFTSFACVLRIDNNIEFWPCCLY